MAALIVWAKGFYSERRNSDEVRVLFESYQRVRTAVKLVLMQLNAEFHVFKVPRATF